MSLSTPSFVQVTPSYVVPEIILNYNQASGAFDLLASGDPMTRLSDGDQYVYIRKMDVRAKVAAGQTAYNQLPGVALVTGQIETPTYLMRTRAEYDHHDTAALGRWNASTPEVYRLGMRQGMFQQARNAILYGFNPQNGEGLLNTQGATSVTLPADSNGHTQITQGYDSGQLALFLLQQITDAMTRMNQWGQAQRCVILGPQRLLGRFQLMNIVQLTQFQREGAGTATTAAMMELLGSNADIDIEWQYDDTLIGKGAGGTDAIILTFPEVKKPRGGRTINTNEFAELTPGLSATNLMFCDMAAPREIPTPLPGGAIDVVSEWRITSGWGVRPEATTIISMAY